MVMALNHDLSGPQSSTHQMTGDTSLLCIYLFPKYPVKAATGSHRGGRTAHGDEARRYGYGGLLPTGGNTKNPAQSRFSQRFSKHHQFEYDIRVARPVALKLYSRFDVFRMA